MLESSLKFISGSEATRLNKACMDYLDSSLIIKDNETIKKQASATIKELCEFGGLYESTDYCVSMTDIKGSVKLDEDYLKEKYPEIYQECLRKEVAPSVRIGKITPKGDRV